VETHHRLLLQGNVGHGESMIVIPCIHTLLFSQLLRPRPSNNLSTTQENILVQVSDELLGVQLALYLKPVVGSREEGSHGEEHDVVLAR